MSASEFSLARLFAKFCTAWEKEGGTRADMNKLAQGKLATARLIANLHGRIVPVVTEVIVDCDAPLPIIDGLEILQPEQQIRSRFRGKLYLKKDTIALFLADGQRDDGIMKGVDLERVLEGQSVLPDPVLDALLLFQELIPEACKGKRLYFWGTKRRDADGNLCVRCLCWNGMSWFWGFSWLGHEWDSTLPAALLVS
ncbi:hypothetical protein KBD18_00595 [Patescibacteria group bacterium]|nr:hypothetical protein [Patescibacteria group bacterium]